MPCSQCGSDQGGNGRLCPVCIEENQIAKSNQLATVRFPKRDSSETYQRTMGLFPRVFYLCLISILVALSVGLGLFYGVPQFQLEMYNLGGSKETALLLAVVSGSYLPQLCLGLYLLAFTITRKPWWAVGYLVVTVIVGAFGVVETIFGQLLLLLFHLAYLRHLVNGRIYETAAAVMVVSLLISVIQLHIFFPSLSLVLGRFLAWQVPL